MARSRLTATYESVYHAAYEQGVAFLEPRTATIALRRFLSKHRFTKRAEVIEFGCGEGRDTSYLAKRGFSIVDTDISRSALSKARKKLSSHGVRANLIVGDMGGAAGFRGETFDLVVNIDSIHFLTSGSARLRHFSEARRILRDGGYYFLCAHVGERDRSEAGGLERSEFSVRGKRRRLVLPRMPAYVRTLADYCHELETAGFLILEKTVGHSAPVPARTCVVVARKTGTTSRRVPA